MKQTQQTLLEKAKARQPRLRGKKGFPVRDEQQELDLLLSYLHATIRPFQAMEALEIVSCSRLSQWVDLTLRSAIAKGLVTITKTNDDWAE